MSKAEIKGSYRYESVLENVHFSDAHVLVKEVDLRLVLIILKEMLEEKVLELGYLFAFVFDGHDAFKYLTDQLNVVRCVFVEFFKL